VPAPQTASRSVSTETIVPHCCIDTSFTVKTCQDTVMLPQLFNRRMFKLLSCSTSY